MNRRWIHSGPPNFPFTLNRQSSQARGLVAWWPFLGSQGSNVLRDFSGNNNGAISGATWVIGRGLLFANASSGEFVDIPAIIISDPMTISFWARPTDAADFRGVIGKDTGDGADSTYVNLRSDRFQWRAHGSGQQVILHNYTSNGQPQHYCAVLDNGNSELFIDGLSVSTGSTTQTAFEWSEIGRFWTNNNFIFSGEISEIRLYNRALTPIEIYQSYTPQTRWELYRPVYIPKLVGVPGPAPGAVFVPYYYSLLTGGI